MSKGYQPEGPRCENPKPPQGGTGVVDPKAPEKQKDVVSQSGTKDTRFKPGQSGNPEGKNAGDKTERQRARRILNDIMAANDYTKIVRLAEALYLHALEGDTAAAKILLEYALGKPDQAIEISGELGITLANFKTALERERGGV